MQKRTILGAIGAIALLATAAHAVVTFDPATGTGFVGKGDVQLVYSWNNKALQDNANLVQFQATSVVISEVTWTCTRSTGQVQERARTTTTTTEGVLASVVRERNQITGFVLTGYDRGPRVQVQNTGPTINDCGSGELTIPAGDPEVVSSTTTLEVSIDGTNWFELL